MTIISARFANEDHSAVEAQIQGRGAVLIGSNPADVVALDAWVASGNTVEAYTELPASTDPNDYPLEPFQFEAMLEILGKVDAVDAAINAITDPTVRAVARAKRRAPPGGLYERSDPLFDALDDTVFPGLTEAERNAAIDTAWMQAKDIV
jgi:hypothetical protein